MFINESNKNIKSLKDFFNEEKVPEEKKKSAKEILNSDKKAISINVYAEKFIEHIKPIVWQGEVFIFKAPIWKRLTEDEFDLNIRQIFSDDFPYSSKNFKELYRCIKSSPKINVDKESIEQDDKFICFSDGIYDIQTGDILKPSPYFKFFSYINAKVSDFREGDAYYFRRFIENASGGDINWEKRLFEILGCLISGISIKGFFVMVGSKNTGKSQLANFCRELIGEDFCTSMPEPKYLTKQFSVGNLFGKKLCIGSDISSTTLNQDAVAALKRLTGGDWVEGEYKYKDSFSFKNEAKFIICTNHLLTTYNKDEAFEDRIIYLPFHNSVSKEDIVPNIAEKFKNEKGYIIFQALKGLRRLINNNLKFTPVHIDFNLLNIEMGNVDSVYNFIEDECYENVGKIIAIEDIYKEYINYCQINNLEYYNKDSFSKKFKANIFSLVKNIEYYKNSSIRGYKNLGIDNTLEKALE